MLGRMAILDVVDVRVGSDLGSASNDIGNRGPELGELVWVENVRHRQIAVLVIEIDLLCSQHGVTLDRFPEKSSL